MIKCLVRLLTCRFFLVLFFPARYLSVSQKITLYGLDQTNPPPLPPVTYYLHGEKRCRWGSLVEIRGWRESWYGKDCGGFFTCTRRGLQLIRTLIKTPKKKIWNATQMRLCCVKHLIYSRRLPSFRMRTRSRKGTGSVSGNMNHAVWFDDAGCIGASVHQWSWLMMRVDRQGILEELFVERGNKSIRYASPSVCQHLCMHLAIWHSLPLLLAASFPKKCTVARGVGFRGFRSSLTIKV